MNRWFKTLACAAGSILTAAAAPVFWVDWTSATSGVNGSATGVLHIGAKTVDVTYTGQIAFAQTNGGGANYWNPSTPYISPAVDNAPTGTDIIANSTASVKTLTFSEPVDNLFFALVSLNGNGYQFDSDFDVVSSGCGYWGCGGLTKVTVPGGYQVNSTGGEPHGVIRFKDAISSITWTSLTNEYWNGFTVGTYGLADPSEVPEPATIGTVLFGIALIGFGARRRASAR